tara:strand:+ start:2738 stop:2899 length:162 start_codon:yes stop_codon:yes gene_type:complete
MYDIQVQLKPDNAIDAKKLKKAQAADIVKELNRIVSKFKKRGMTEYNNISFNA